MMDWNLKKLKNVAGRKYNCEINEVHNFSKWQCPCLQHFHSSAWLFNGTLHKDSFSGQLVFSQQQLPDVNEEFQADLCTVISLAYCFSSN